MLRTVLGRYVDVITEAEAIHSLVIDPGEHVAFLGAGLSREAGVPLADEICTKIRHELALSETQPDDEWARDKLNLDRPELRYSTCLEKYGTAASRVDYFRRLLKGVSPSFAHHALTLLMANDVLHPSALESLGVTSTFVPLIGAGAGEVKEANCLDAILEGADSSKHLSPDHHLTIVIFDEIILDSITVQRISRRWKSKAKPR
jgi:hypothetical protein